LINRSEPHANPLFLLPFTDFQQPLLVKDQISVGVTANLPDFSVNEGRDRTNFNAEPAKAAKVVVNDEDDGILAFVSRLVVNGFNVDAVVWANALASEATDAIFFARPSVNGQTYRAPVSQSDWS
jgi:hypothetical protein